MIFATLAVKGVGGRSYDALTRQFHRQPAFSCPSTENMTQKTYRHPALIVSSLIFLALLSQSDLVEASDSVAYYSDNQNDRIVAFDPVAMTLRGVIRTKGKRPYPIGKANDRTSYVSTRDSFSIDELNNFHVVNGEIRHRTIRSIELEHSPRSFAYGPARGIAVVAGNSHPWATLLMPSKSGESAVQRLFKERRGPFNVDGSNDENIGGNTSSGHPLCVEDGLFVLLNRTKRTISLFNMNQGQYWPLDTLNLADLEEEEWVDDPDIRLGSTLSSAHHVTRSPRGLEKVYFASLEGSLRDRTILEPAGVLKFIVVGEELVFVDYQSTRGAAHHLDVTRDGKYILQGTTEDGKGKLYILNAGESADSAMSTAGVIEAGAGAGHVFFADTRGLAIVTNHDDKFLTIIDMDWDDDGNIDAPSSWTSTKAWIPRGAIPNDPGNIGRSSTRAVGQKIQAHTASVSGSDPAERYYYGSAAADGIFYRIDLDNLYKYEFPDGIFPAEDMLDVEAELGDSYLIQGDYNWNKPSGPMGGMN